MARAGGFGGVGGFGSPSLNPFGGSGAGFTGYDVGADLADLDVYQTEVAWRNGQATDEQYLAALRKVVDATDPETRRRVAAQDALDDALYRIGRSKAEAKGLDALVAFDQSALAKMRPDNLRFRDVKQSLDSELASRRSRDYGKLVDEYNDGGTSTQSLLDWVRRTVGTLKSDDPDFANWTGVRGDLERRLASEHDAKVYQSYQQGRLSPEKFLTYLTTRRDGFDPSSPDYADWSRKLEDATKQVTTQEQSKKDQAFFARYEEGKVADRDYLKYLRTRIEGMEPDDPQKPEWQHRLHQAAFSLAEDQLRFDVQHGKAPVSRLIGFYRDYRRTLNPASAEWRTITRALDSLARGGGGGGGGAGGAGGGAGKGSAVGAIGVGKIITSTSLPDAVLPLLTINPLASKKDQAAAKKYFDLNYQSLQNARQRGDGKWLFYDPRHPNAVTAMLDPSGTPILGADGRPLMVRGTAYLDVKDQTFAELNGLNAKYHYALAEIALAKHDAGGFAYQTKLAIEASDKGRLVEAQYIAHDNQQFFDHAQDGIDLALKTSDYATAMNLANEVASRLAGELANPMLDDTRRDKLNALGERLAANPLLPKFDPATGTQIGGAIDLASSTVDRDGHFASVELLPGWHKILDSTSPTTGKGDWGLTFDTKQDGTWEANHITVQTKYGDRVVTGEVTVGDAPTNPTVVVHTPEGIVGVPTSSARFFSFVDEHGQLVRAYSLDGQTWLRALPGTPAPVVEVSGDLTRRSYPGEGTFLVDGEGNRVFEQNADESWAEVPDYFAGHPEALTWFGQRAYEAKAAGVGKLSERVVSGTYWKAPNIARTMASELTDARRDALASEVGGPGQHMLIASVSPDGAVNMLPSATELHVMSRTEYLAKATWLTDTAADVADYLGLRRKPLAATRSPGGGGMGAALVHGPAWNRTGETLRKQMPTDTPTRYEGRGFTPISPPPLIKSLSVGGGALRGVQSVLPPPLTRAQKDDIYVPPPLKAKGKRASRPPTPPRRPATVAHGPRAV